MLARVDQPTRSEGGRAWSARDESWRRRLLRDVRSQEAALRENHCPPALLRPLAAAWFGLLPEITGDDALTRLRNLLAPDTGLVDAALTGLRGAPARTDVPAAEDVIRRHAAGEEYHLALPVLAGLAAIDVGRPDETPALDERRLRSALAFCIEQVRRTLDNGPPANAGDLAALLVDRLRGIAEEIRTSNTNDWRLFWNEGPRREPIAPKHENSCRGALLSRLRDRLPPGVDAQPEGHYADDRRADVRVACGDFNVPIEVKKDSHRDLWSAVRDQLIARYAQDPATDGYGIYLVLWFGEDGPPPPDGRPNRSAGELETRLTESLSAAEARRIVVCVIDVGRPRARGG